MGIQSTKTITREMAIERINKIHQLCVDNDAIAINEITNETELSTAFLREFIWRVQSENENLDIPADASTLLDSELEDVMDLPFYRFSDMENYSVEN